MTDNEMDKLIKKHKIWAADNCCWWTCIQLAKKEKCFKVIEGLADGFLHFWLEKDGEMFDIHFHMIGEMANKFDRVAEIDIKNIEINRSDSFEKHGVNFDGEECFRKMPDVIIK